MKNIPEINHCIPNPRAYWCRFCKAHNTFDYAEGRMEYHLCKACRGAWGVLPDTGMFNPGEMKEARKVILGGAGCLIVVGGVAALYAPGAVDPLLACAVIGAVLGLIVLLGSYWVREFSAWASAQRRKSPEELRQEALDHPFQPEYDNSADFTEWAEQFLTPEEVERLHEKYGESEDGEKQEARIALRVEGEGGPPPPAPGE